MLQKEYLAFFPPWLGTVAAVAGAAVGFLAHPTGSYSLRAVLPCPIHPCAYAYSCGRLVCPLAQAGFILSCLQRGHPAGCRCMCQYQLVASVNSTEFVCPCCRAGHLRWHPKPRAGLQITHHHCSLGSRQKAEERCMAEPGSSSDEWEHGGKLFGCLGDLIPGGGTALSPEITAVVEHSVRVAAATRLKKINWSETWRG